MSNTLLIQASARSDASTSRALTRKLAERLGGSITTRDVAQGLPLIDEAWIGANFTAAEERSPQQTALLELSEELIGEIEAADTLVIGLPIYNFGIPGALKAYIDLIAHARRTFEYSPTGPNGLLTGKKAYIVVTSGGTEAFSAIDFATPHLRHVLGFIGITDVEIIRADQQMMRGEAAISGAEAQIDAIGAPAAA